MNQDEIAADVQHIHHQRADHGELQERPAPEKGNERHVHALHKDEGADPPNVEQRIPPDLHRHADEPQEPLPAEEKQPRQHRAETEIGRHCHGAHLVHLGQVARAAVVRDEDRRRLTHHRQRQHNHIEYHIVIAHGGHRVL